MSRISPSSSFASSSTASSSSSTQPVNSVLAASLDSAAHAKAIALASTVLEACAEAGVGNPTVALSAVHLVTTLAYQSMRWNPAEPRDAASDRLVLSDAAFSPAVYAACADLGVPALVDGAWRPLAAADLKRLGAGDGPLPLTPAAGTVALFEHAVGAPGAGLSFAAGHALASRLESGGKDQVRESERRIYCLVGESEAREGQVFEALAHIVEERLATVVPVFVVGSYATGDRAAGVDGSDALARRLTAIGFHVASIDGHAPAQIRDAVEQAHAKAKSSQPTAIVARCTKGWGAKSLQGGAWSGRIPTGDRLKVALEELRATRVGLARSFGSEIGRPTPRADGVRVQPIAGVATALDAVPDFARAMREADMIAVYQSGRLAPRRAQSLALRALGRAHAGIVVGECDARANGVAELFAADRALAPRFHEYRGAEAHMVGAASAMSVAGRVPFVASTARGFARAHEAIELAVRNGTNLKIVATGAGLGGAAEGAAATSVSDVAWFRALSAQRDAAGNPAAYLLQPSDAFAAYALSLAAAEHEGVSMLRLPSGEQEFLYNAETVFNLGKFEVLFEGRDLLIVTAGAMVHEVNRALDGLDRAGIEATIVDLYSLPFDEAALLDLANANEGRILVVEDNIGAPLAGAISEACTASGDAFTIESMCVRTPPAGARSFAEALKLAGLSAEDIVNRASRMAVV